MRPLKGIKPIQGFESKVIESLRMKPTRTSNPKEYSMKAEQVVKFKKLFEEQKAALLYSYKAINTEFTLNSDEMSDEVDLSSAELEQGMRMRLRSREALFMKKIDSALEKIQAGTFGSCECCEEEIELSRLEVRPTADLCINCKEEQEMRETRSADGRKSKSMGSQVQLRIA
jgi:DnaK suppressor protein